MPGFAADVTVVVEDQMRQVLPADARLEKLATDFKFTEGPAWSDADGGYLVFSDIPGDVIRKWTPAGGISIFRSPSFNANGNTRDLEGRLLTCEHGSRKLRRQETDGTMTILAERFGGKLLNSPNDVVVKSDGSIWFTDPPYGIKKEQIEQPKNHVFRLDPKTLELRPVVDDFDMPNGLCFSPDEKKLYIADSGKPHHVRVFDVKPDGTLSGGAVFCVIDKGVPDGMRFDIDGRLWSSAKDGIQIFNSDGKLIGRILVPETPANLCFGGADRQTLFITAQKSLYSIRTKLKGAR